jgi:thiamine-phosphate pyrophosphorylase
VSVGAVEVNGLRRLDPAALRLVAITDSLRDGIDGLVGRAEAAVAGGATMVQLRLEEESARSLVEIARALCRGLPGTPIVVNARADVALAAGAAGVHLGLDDISPEALRRVVPPTFVIGVSAGDRAFRFAFPASLRDADYVAVGPVFSAAHGATHPVVGLAGVAEIAAEVACPVLAVGGITAANVASTIAAGAAGVAVISAFLGAADPRQHARALRAALDASER